MTDDHSNLAVRLPRPALPAPRTPITIRPGTSSDLSCMDALQKKQSRQVGFFPTRAMEGKIAAGQVLVALAEGGKFAGYLIGQDQYFKRDDLGVIYQINIAPEFRRSLVAATLLKTQFERSAYGCKLYCCWCAQDIEANQFWESMGFAAIAYRAGSESRGAKGSPRVHIFWQKRIRAGDVSTTWWFPSKTTGGALSAERIVLPIPPGMSWQDELPILLPEEEAGQSEVGKQGQASAGLPAPKSRRHGPETVDAKEKKPAVIQTGRLRVFGSDPTVVPDTGHVASAAPTPKPRPRKKKHDPELISRARDLRDKWLEHVGANGLALEQGKYEVVRLLPDPARERLIARAA